MNQSIDNENSAAITGFAALEVAKILELPLNKYTDPIEEARWGLSIEEAEEVAAVDPALIWLPIPLGGLRVPAEETFRSRRNSYGWSVLDDFGGRWWPSETLGDLLNTLPANVARALAIHVCVMDPTRGEWCG